MKNILYYVIQKHFSYKKINFFWMAIQPRQQLSCGRLLTIRDILDGRIQEDRYKEIQRDEKVGGN